MNIAIGVLAIMLALLCAYASSVLFERKHPFIRHCALCEQCGTCGRVANADTHRGVML